MFVEELHVNNTNVGESVVVAAHRFWAESRIPTTIYTIAI